jgi:hypothetical protein
MRPAGGTTCERQLRLGRHAKGVLVVAIVAISAWLGRERVLRGAACLWIVSDPVTRADAIVVLVGNGGRRSRD